MTIGSDKIKLKPDNKDENPFRYCGEYYDKETEEVYLRARYYEPEVGRFLTRDTYTGEEDEPESLHLYAYCGNDGVNSVDPSGHKIKYSKSGIKFTKKNELGKPKDAETKKIAILNKKNKIKKIKLHWSGIKYDHYINYGYGHTIRPGEGGIHKDDKSIYNRYLKGKHITYKNVNKKKIWISEKACSRRLEKDFKYIVKKINKDLPKLKLNQNQADAVIDFRYVAGSLSPVLDAFEANNPQQIRKAMYNYTNVDKRRRNSINNRFMKK